MSTTEKNLKNSVRISFDRIISDSLRYLGNLSDFFRVLVDKNADDALPDVFSRILPELEQHRKRLVEFQHRSMAQVKGSRESIVSADKGMLLDAVSEHEWFQKSYRGRSSALRTVSRDESIGLAIKAIMLGVVFIHHVPAGSSGGFRKWRSNFRNTMYSYLSEFLEDQKI